MLPVVADLLVAVPPAAAAYGATRKWPHRDPAAPRLLPEVIAENVARRPRLARLLRSRVDPAKETGLLLTAALVGATFCVTGVGLLVRMIHSNSGLASYDLAFARWGAHNASQISTSGLKLISLFGGYQALAVLSVVVAAVEFRRGMGRSVVPFLVLTVAGQFLVVNAVKAVVNRPRPNIARLTGFSGASFPSGHAAAAACSFAVFSLLLGRRRSPASKAVLAAVAAAITTAVAGSRVLLGVHWFTDVVAGIAIGWAWFTLISLAFGGRILRFGAPVAQAEAVQQSLDSPSGPPRPTPSAGR